MVKLMPMYEFDSFRIFMENGKLRQPIISYELVVFSSVNLCNSYVFLVYIIHCIHRNYELCAIDVIGFLRTFFFPQTESERIYGKLLV